MQSKSDAQLLREYAETGAATGAEAAFTELVRRHTNLVYSAALRQVESPDAATEITQRVFIGLARSARELAPQLTAEASLAGWLCRSARNLSLNHRRDEFRRHNRERHAMEQFTTLADGAPDWDSLRRVLDDAMSELSEADYDAIVLRYFQNEDFRAVGAAIGVSDDTAQKRVARALEKLRELLSRRGIRATAAALSVAISANAVQAAPVGLVVTISAAALAGTAVTTATIIAAATKTIAMTTLQKTLLAVVVVATGSVPFVMQHRSLVNLRAENQVLSQQIGQLDSQVENLSDSLATANSAGAATSDQVSELMRLRGAVGRQRQETNELAALRAEIQQMRSTLEILRQQIQGPNRPNSNDVASAKSLILNNTSSVLEKLQALRVLRSADSRTDDVVREMVNAYYATDDARFRADIFRQLSGVTTPELKRPLLEAVSDVNQDTNVRQEAAETLADYLADPDVKKWLEHLAVNDADPEVQKEAVRSLRGYQARQQRSQPGR